jgi:hypothetical protein
VKKLISVVILIAGIVLLAMGYQEYQSAGSRVGRVFGFGVSDKAAALFLSGSLCTLIGLIRIVR